MNRGSARGFSLIELVVAITIIGICSSTVLGLTSTLSSRSAEAMVQAQATAIARSYLDEITAKEFAVLTQSFNRREYFNDVRDYQGLDDVGAKDVRNQPMAGLGNYHVQVAVAPSAFNGIPSTQALRIVVTVTDPLARTISLSAFKTAP
jgi:MSHA pilin protein MshD